MTLDARQPLQLWRAAAAYYERLPVGDDYFANVQAYAQAERARDLAKIGQPVDRSEWGMTASTVNAYYSPSMCVLLPAVRSIAGFRDGRWCAAEQMRAYPPV